MYSKSCLADFIENIVINKKLRFRFPVLDHNVYSKPGRTDVTNLGLGWQEAALAGLVDHGGLHEVRLGLVGQVVVGVAPAAAAAGGTGRAARSIHLHVDGPGPPERIRNMDGCLSHGPYYRATR